MYAVFSYEAQQSDELSFEVNDQLIILRKGDDAEREWWWAKMKETGKEGYVPRNLLGVSWIFSIKIEFHSEFVSFLIDRLYWHQLKPFFFFLNQYFFFLFKFLAVCSHSFETTIIRITSIETMDSIQPWIWETEKTIHFTLCLTSRRRITLFKTKKMFINGLAFESIQSCTISNNKFNIEYLKSTQLSLNQRLFICLFFLYWI